CGVRKLGGERADRGRRQLASAAREERPAKLMRGRGRRLALALDANDGAVLLDLEADLDGVVEEVQVAHPAAEPLAEGGRRAAHMLDEAGGAGREAGGELKRQQAITGEAEGLGPGGGELQRGDPRVVVGEELRRQAGGLLEGRLGLRANRGGDR